jgi:hypothetical protein
MRSYHAFARGEYRTKRPARAWKVLAPPMQAPRAPVRVLVLVLRKPPPVRSPRPPVPPSSRRAPPSAFARPLSVHRSGAAVPARSAPARLPEAAQPWLLRSAPTRRVPSSVAPSAETLCRCGTRSGCGASPAIVPEAGDAKCGALPWQGHYDDCVTLFDVQLTKLPQYARPEKARCCTPAPAMASRAIA